MASKKSTTRKSSKSRDRLRDIREYLQTAIAEEPEDAYDSAYRDALCDVLDDCFGVEVSFKLTFEARA